MGGLTTYLFSKEIYVMEHEYYTGLSILVAVVYATKKFGPAMAKWLDKEIDVSENYRCTVNCNYVKIFFSNMNKNGIKVVLTN
jgi:Mitochondrial ATP synthase B chain precursor (ATP-synt_B)